jgi:hypothetical protein
MKLPAELVITLLEGVEREMETARHAEQLIIVRHAEKDVPQPQLFFAFGLSN